MDLRLLLIRLYSKNAINNITPLTFLFSVVLHIWGRKFLKTLIPIPWDFNQIYQKLKTLSRAIAQTTKNR
ncbi:hypothetical protein IQ231_10315 [Cuspidothrix issatschenkoi LEGE 03284]|jgi:hypothetical protein|uniref:hypothetical protein n=1 Tax=Cuspidothrix issatschenkoi TaxID=230752 RepID=UPI00188073F1|nr:hypothetical protein [Cuspidothrix issatschenkoi]MBE9232072.1 hypothetical protein [Cuspidothrix issatschenkoi LEGE 03284]